MTKAHYKQLFLLPVLIVGLGLIPVGRVTAQAFTTVHSFTATSSGESTNADGSTPYAGLLLLGETLFGTAYQGGSVGYGTVFSVNTDGADFTNLHNFTAISGTLQTNGDGVNPTAGVLLSGNTLYGTASGGGSSGNGAVFRVNTNGTGFTNLHSFTALSSPSYEEGTNSDGGYPVAGLILSGETLFGTAAYGGSSGCGIVFRVNTNGMGFTNQHSFTGVSDGANPQAGLVLSGNTLFGTAYYGGSSGYGTLFRVNINGTGFTNLHSFTELSLSLTNYAYTNSDGANPYAGLVLAGETLYGTAVNGGSSDFGTIFAINTNGAGFTNLYNFTAMNLNGSIGASTNSDGAYPNAGLILSGNSLYGTAMGGGSGSAGTVFGFSVVPVLPPPALALQILAGYPMLNLYGTLSNNYIVQYNTNLADTNWLNLLSLTNLATNPYKFIDPSGVAQQVRFYRAFLTQ